MLFLLLDRINTQASTPDSGSPTARFKGSVGRIHLLSPGETRPPSIQGAPLQKKPAPQYPSAHYYPYRAVEGALTASQLDEADMIRGSKGQGRHKGWNHRPLVYQQCIRLSGLGSEKLPPSRPNGHRRSRSIPDQATTRKPRDRQPGQSRGHGSPCVQKAGSGRGGYCRHIHYS